MSNERSDQERPCLYCMIAEPIDGFFAEYPATAGGSDKVDTGEADEVIVAIAKTVAAIRRRLIEELMREIMNHETEFRREDTAGQIGSHARH